MSSTTEDTEITELCDFSLCPLCSLWFLNKINRIRVHPRNLCSMSFALRTYENIVPEIFDTTVKLALYPKTPLCRAGLLVRFPCSWLLRKALVCFEREARNGCVRPAVFVYY